jgi:predicted dinucleotide-binding enzyme
MRIAIIGAGNVGQALGQGWSRRGHEVRYGVRNPADAKYGNYNLYSASAIW